MIPLARNKIAALLVLWSAVIFSSAPAQTSKKPGSSITGKVTIKGKAAPGVVVGLRSSDPGSPLLLSFKATTDQDGKYRLSEVPAGSYQIVALAPAYVGSRGQTVILGESEIVQGIDFALVRGGVVTGKLTDADGRPVVEQRVSLLVADPPPNQRGPIYPINNAQTDDRGIYRMFGIHAGRYKVAAGQGGDSPFVGPSSGRISYKQTFYPDTSDAAKATVVEVTEGSEASNVDIVLGRATQNFAVSGRVINGENDQPLANVRVGLQLVVGGQPTVFMGSTAVSNAVGEFKVENVAPAKYGIFIMPQKDSDVRADAVRFEVMDQDVSGLVLKTTKGSTMAGTIMVENADDRTVLARLMQLQVVGYIQSAGAMGNFGHAATINSDGSFLLTGLEAGTARLSLNAQDRNLMKGFTVARIERDGVVQPRGLEVKNGDEITGVRLVVSYGTAVVHGAVQLENGPLPEGARILVMYRKSGDAPTIGQAQLDARSHFIVEGLATGTYDFFASVTMPAPTRARPIRATRQITTIDGAVTEVILVLDLNANPDPVRPPVRP